MDLPSLPLDVLRIIFCNPGNSCLNFEDDHGVLVCPVYVLLRLRLVCKSWRSMAGRLPTCFGFYSKKYKDAAQRPQKFIELFPDCRELILYTSLTVPISAFDCLSRVDAFLYNSSMPSDLIGLQCLSRLKTMSIYYNRDYDSANTKRSRVTMLSQILLPAAASLTNLSLRYLQVEDPNFSLAPLRKLRTLHIDACRFPPHTFTSLSSLAQLKSFKLISSYNSMPLSENERIAIGSLLSLESLALHETIALPSLASASTSAYVVAGWSRLTQLSRLVLQSYVTNDDSLCVLEPFRRLTYLNVLSEAEFPNASLSPAALFSLSKSLPNLVCFRSLEKLIHDDNTLPAFCSFTSLQEATFLDWSYHANQIKISDQCFGQNLTSLRQLFRFAARKTNLGALGMKALCSLLSLRELRLDSCGFIPPSSFYMLSSLSQLVDVNLSNSKLPADIAHSLSSSEHLRALVLRNTPVSLLEPLKRCAYLQHLDLSCTAVTDKAIRTLSELHRLTFLALDDVPLTYEGLVGALYNTGLYNLSLRQTRQTSHSRVTLEGAQSLARFTRLSELNFGTMPISSEVYRVLVQHISFMDIVLAEVRPAHIEFTKQYCTELRQLHFQTHESTATMMPLLAEFTKLTSLWKVRCFGPDKSMEVQIGRLCTSYQKVFQNCP